MNRVRRSEGFNLSACMNTNLRVLTFGVVSGLIWSVIPGLLSELFRSTGETVTVLVSGILTGALTSFALRAPLAKCRRQTAILLGLLSLPFGAFAFGVLTSLVQWVVRELTGTSYRFVAHDFSPFHTGISYAVLSAVSIFAFVLFPLAVLTTFLLRAMVLSGSRHETAT
jgi:hypothetical protein